MVLASAVKWAEMAADYENGRNSKKILNFGCFYSCQPFRPILRPRPKPCWPPLFLTFFGQNMKNQYQMHFLDFFWNVVLPYLEKIQFSKF